MAERVLLVVENRYAVPVEYAGAWLTDLRPDDGTRWFGMPGPATISREGDTFRTEAPLPIGVTRGVVTITSPTSWRGQSEVLRGGRPVLRMRIAESVRGEGGSTVHHVEVHAQPLTWAFRLWRPLLRIMVGRTLRSGFRRMGRDMEADYLAGRPPRG